MHYFGLIDSVIWISGMLAGCVLAAVMLRRGLVRSYPAFFTSILFDLAREIVLPAVAYHSARAYEYGYWLTLPISLVISVAVVLEAYRCSIALKPKLSAMSVCQLAFSGAVLLGLVTYSFLDPHVPVRNLVSLLLLLHRSSAVLRCSLLLFVMTFAPKLGISWRHHVWGIVLGLGLCAAGDLLQSTVSTISRVMASGNWLARVPPSCYLISVILWTVYLGRPEPARDPATLKKLSLLNYILRTCNKILIEVRRTMSNANHG
jgi:hypothetical protein